MSEAHDTDRTGYIDRAEYDACLKTELMRQTYQDLSLDMHYASRLFDIIDTSDDGQVDVEEFIDSMARLTRPARFLGFRSFSAAWLKLRTDGLLALKFESAADGADGKPKGLRD